MLVENKKYYHIQRNPTWNVGEIHEYGTVFNLFCNYIYENGTNCKCSNPINEESINLNPIIYANEILKVNGGDEKDKNLRDYIDYNPYSLIEILRSTLIEHMKFAREEIFEMVRQELFPDKPSRKKSIWLIEDDKKAVNYWYNILKKETQKLFEVEVTGKIHISDQQYLDLSADPLNKIKERAAKYWNAEKLDSPTINECVFIGVIKVIAERDIIEFKL